MTLSSGNAYSFSHYSTGEPTRTYVEADTITDAISIAEAAVGKPVHNGRQLDPSEFEHAQRNATVRIDAAGTVTR